MSNTGTNGLYEKFTIRAVVEGVNGGTFKVDADFTFPDFTTFTNTNNFSWGLSNGVTSNFYFSELSTSGSFFFASPVNIPSTPVNCNVSVHANAVGDYIEFSFSGNYEDAIDSSIQGYVEGVARVLRTADQ